MFLQQLALQSLFPPLQVSFFLLFVPENYASTADTFSLPASTAENSAQITPERRGMIALYHKEASFCDRA